VVCCCRITAGGFPQLQIQLCREELLRWRAGAVINALQQWRRHLEGAKEVVVVTDHKPNTYLGLDSKPSVQLRSIATVACGRWQWVTVDVITDLPETRAGHTAFVVFVDRLSKMMHFDPCWNHRGAEEFAQIFVREIFRDPQVPGV